MANITNNTIFDDVFRTMVEKMPNLAVPLINEIFGTSYPEDIKIIQRRNEHQTKQGELITDSQLLIAEKIYHLECQSTQDSEMVVRMIEYDFSIGLETMEKEYRDLIELIIRIADYILRKRKKARKGFGDVMGGKVLELESDRLIKQGLQRGMQQGMQQGLQRGMQQGLQRGMQQGLQRGMQQGRTEVIQVIKLLRQGMTIGETARKLKLSEEEVQQIWEETEG